MLQLPHAECCGQKTFRPGEGADGSTNPATGGASCGPGIDYVSQTGTLTFPASGAGSTSQTITIGVCGDTVFEPNETFFVELSGETNATLSDGEGRGTIQNDDAPPPLAPVNTTDDLDDGTCNVAHCSLREAINTANASAGAVSITFAIPATDARHFYYFRHLHRGRSRRNGRDHCDPRWRN